MNDAEKQAYLAGYKEKKANGELFFPHSIGKDAVTSLFIFIVLLGLAIFAGVPEEPPANPSDAAYIPRPEWYFLWMFQGLKYLPSRIAGIPGETLGVLFFGALAAALLAVPWLDRRGRGIAVAAVLVLTLAAVLTVLALLPAAAAKS